MSKHGLTVHPEKTRLHPVPPGGSARLRNDGRRLLPARNIRLPGLHPLLGPGTGRRMGDQTQDGQEPDQASASGAVGLVPAESPPAGHGSTPNAEAEAAGSLRVLRNHGQLLQPPGDSGRQRRKIWKHGCRGDAAAGSCRGQTFPVWSNATGSLGHVWSIDCSAAQRHEVTSQMREICTSGSCKQNTHLVTPGQIPPAQPIIGLPALLRLVEWYRARRNTQQGGFLCVNLKPPLSPRAAAK